MELPIERLGLIAYSGCRLTTALHYKTGAWSSIHQWKALYNRESKPWTSLQKIISLHLNGCSNLVMLSKTSLIKYVMTKNDYIYYTCGILIELWWFDVMFFLSGNHKLSTCFPISSFLKSYDVWISIFPHFKCTVGESWMTFFKRFMQNYNKVSIKLI